MSESLAGQLLIASPSIEDWFRRALILMIEHNEEGAFGLVLNRPSQTTVSEVSDELAASLGAEHLIRVGGPVAPNAVTAIGEHPDPEAATKLVVDDVGMVDLDASEVNLGRVRVYAGYAGWGPGQLEAELEAEAWILEPARRDDPFGEGDLWAGTLRRMGGQYELLAQMPADPSVN